MDSFPLLFYGYGQSGFQYFSGTCWKRVDYITDNGMNRGYSGYSRGRFVGYGKLAVFDEIDKEMDVITGGPLAMGWVTHFPEDHCRPPATILVDYQSCKREFRRFFATLPLLPGVGLTSFLASSVGQRVYRIANRDPTTAYGLGNKDDSSSYDYAVGYNGLFHAFPTITSNYNYYNTLFQGDYDILNYLLPNSASRINNTATSSTNNAGTQDESS